MLRTYKTEAIIIKRINLGEADRLVTVFSKDLGKKVFMAKGIRRSTSRKKGHLELFNHAQLVVAKGKGLDLITEASTVNNFSTLKKNLNRVRIAYLFAELVDKLTVEDVEQVEVFHLLVRALHHLSSLSAPKTMVVDFEKDLLQNLGFGLPGHLGAVPTQQKLEGYILSLTDKSLKSKEIR